MKKYLILLLLMSFAVLQASAQTCPIDLQEPCPENPWPTPVSPHHPTNPNNTFRWNSLKYGGPVVKWAADVGAGIEVVNKQGGSGCDGAWPIHIGQMTRGDGSPAVCGSDLLQLVIYDTQTNEAMQNIIFPVGATLNSDLSVLDRQAEKENGVPHWDAGLCGGNSMSSYFPNRYVHVDSLNNRCSTCNPCPNGTCHLQDGMVQVGFFLPDSKVWFEKAGFHRDAGIRHTVDQFGWTGHSTAACRYPIPPNSSGHKNMSQTTEAEEYKFLIRMYDSSTRYWGRYSAIFLSRYVFNHSSAVGVELEDGNMFATAIKGRQNNTTGDEASGNNILNANDTEFYEFIWPNWVSSAPNQQTLLTGSATTCSDNGRSFDTYFVGPSQFEHPYNHTTNTNIDISQEGKYKVEQERANGMMGRTSFEVNENGDACLFTPKGVTFEWAYDNSAQEMCIDPIYNRKRLDEYDWMTYMASFTFDLEIPEDDQIDWAILYYEGAERYCPDPTCVPWVPTDMDIATFPNGSSGNGYLYYITEPGEIKDVILFPGLPPGTTDLNHDIPTYTIQGHVRTVGGLTSNFTFETTFMPSY